MEMNAELLVGQIRINHVSFLSNFKTKFTTHVHLIRTIHQKLGAQPKWIMTETMLLGKSNGGTVVRCVRRPIRKKFIFQVCANWKYLKQK